MKVVSKIWNTLPIFFGEIEFDVPLFSSNVPELSNVPKFSRVSRFPAKFPDSFFSGIVES